MMKSRPCGSVAGSVRPSFRPGVCSRVNRSDVGLLPSAMALNWPAYLLAGLYATTIEVPAYWMYHFVNFGISRVNRSDVGLLPSAMALNWPAYLLAGLYATTIEVPAYWMYHFVNFGISGVMLSPPTLSKTFGLISPAAISASSAPEVLPCPV